jgi:hypothetical protein
MKNKIIASLCSIILLTGAISGASAAPEDTGWLFFAIESYKGDTDIELWHRMFVRKFREQSIAAYKTPGLLQKAILANMPIAVIKFLIEKQADQKSRWVVNLRENNFSLPLVRLAHSTPSVSPLELLNLLKKALEADKKTLESLPGKSMPYMSNHILSRDASINTINKMMELLGLKACVEEESSGDSSCEDRRTQKKAKI